MDGLAMPRPGFGTWPITDRNVDAIPKSTDPEHVHANFAAQEIPIDGSDLERIDSLHEWNQQRVDNPHTSAWGWQVTND